MARLTKEEHDRLLSEISEKTNASPEVMDLIGKLREDFDESLSVDTEEVTREYETQLENLRGERDKAIGERDEARRAYRDRFFNVDEEAQRIVAREKKDSPKTIDEILTMKEEK